MGKGKRRRSYGSYQSRRRKKRIREALSGWWVVLGMFALLWLLGWPGLQDFRDTFLFEVLLRSGMSLPYVYFGFLHRKRPPVGGQVFAVLTALAVWAPMLPISRRTVMMLFLLITWADAGAAVWYRVFRQKSYSVLGWAAVHMGMMILMNLGIRVSTMEGFPFWFPSLVIAVAAAWVCFRLLWSGQVVLKDDRLSERVAVVIGAFAIGFYLVWMSCVCANFGLDTSSPKRYDAVVEEKDVSGGRSTSYYVYVTIQEERIRFEITQSEFYRVQVGDECIVEWHRGFLGEPYYSICAIE